MQAETAQLVDRVIATARQTSFIPGGVVGVVAPDREPGTGCFTTTVPFGAADIATATAVTEHTVFETGSLSKLFTALVLADAVADRASGIDLQTPLQAVAPVPVPHDGPSAITLGHLVTHRSGLPRLPGNAVYSPLGRARYRPADLWSAVAGARLLYPPGAGWLYSNFGFGVLGTVLSEVRRRPFADLVADVVCGPLGMTRTGGQPPLPSVPRHLTWWRHQDAAQDDGPAEGLATPYHRSSTPDRPVVAERWNDVGALAGSGGVVSTGADMTRFLAATLGYETGPAAGAFAMIREPVPAADPTLKHMGMAWQFRDSKLPGQLLFKNGGTRGMRSAIAIRVDGPYAGTGVVMLTNGPDQVDTPALRILAGVGRMVAGHGGDEL